MIKRRKNLGEGYNRLATTILVISAIVICIPIIFSFPDYATKGSEWSQNQTAKIIIAILIVIVLSAITLLLGLISIQFGLASIRGVYRHFKGEYKSRIILDESKPHIGGSLVFETEFNSWLQNGFIRIIIKTKYEEKDDFTIRYNKAKKIGELFGIYRIGKDTPIRWRWNIPTNFPDGEYKIKIIIYDMINLLGFKKNINDFTMKHQITITDILVN